MKLINIFKKVKMSLGVSLILLIFITFYQFLSLQAQNNNIKIHYKVIEKARGIYKLRHELEDGLNSHSVSIDKVEKNLGQLKTIEFNSRERLFLSNEILSSVSSLNNEIKDLKVTALLKIASFKETQRERDKEKSRMISSAKNTYKKALFLNRLENRSYENVNGILLFISNIRQLDREYQLIDNKEEIQKVRSEIDILFKNALTLVGKQDSSAQKGLWLETKNELNHFRLHLNYFVTKNENLKSEKIELVSYIETTSAKFKQSVDTIQRLLEGRSNLIQLLTYPLLILGLIFILNTAILISIFKKLNVQKETLNIKTEEKSKFLAAMSHEIRTPLNGVIGTVELIKDNKISDYQLKIIKLSSQTLKNHIDNILDISKIESGNMETSSTTRLLSSVFQDLKIMLTLLAKEKNCDIKIRNSIFQDDIELTLDHVKLKQILINIVSNSIKYGDNFKSEKFVEIEYYYVLKNNHIGELFIKVIDNGVGMNQAEVNYYSKPFKQFSTNYDIASSGLGANVAKEFVHLMNGSFSISSEKFIGSEVNLVLPFVIKQAHEAVSDLAQTKKKELITATIKKKVLTILIIEDHPFNRYVLEQQLMQLGHQYLSADNGVEAVDLISKSKEIDLVITDINMPEMNGVEFAHYVREELKLHTPIIALTADALKHDHEIFLQNGIHSVLTKPISATELSEAIQEHTK
ncbi:response regulator [Shewanella sp. 10N.261.52.F9]|uniref:response regulator n=1 Tax=Shewanella sp. 10N.261.52.F9 TaxID=3229684 RepID=UPI0035504DDE